MADRPAMRPRRAAAAAICSVQPGFAVATRPGCVASMCAALRSPSSRAASRLDQVVDAGAAAADLLLGERQQLDAGNRAQQIARRLADALRVREVAGVVIRHAHRERMPRRSRRTELGEDLGDVAHARRERARALGPRADRRRAAAPYSFIDDPQPAALTAMRSTPARSNTSIVRRAKARASSSRPACSASAPQHPCSGGATTSQPSAASTLTVASLTRGNDEALHAAGQQADGQPAFADGGRPRRDASRTSDAQRHRRRQREHRAEAREQPLRTQRGALADARALRSNVRLFSWSRFGARRPRARSSGSALLDERPALHRALPASPSGTSAMRRRAGNGNSAKIARAEEAIGERPRIAPFDLPARRFDERRVLHARRARGDARHAAEARVEVADERRASSPRARRAPAFIR